MALEIQLWQFILGLIVLVFGAGGLNYLTSKASLNGFKLFATDKLNAIDHKVEQIDRKVSKHGEDIAVLKSKVKECED